MNRAEASWDLLRNDRVSTPGKTSVLGVLGDLAVKGHDALSNAIPSVLTPIDQNDYTVARRDAPWAATRERIRGALMARWFSKGNPLNIIPKALSAVTEMPDGMLSDVLHAGNSTQGTVLHTAA